MNMSAISWPTVIAAVVAVMIVNFVLKKVL